MLTSIWEDKFAMYNNIQILNMSLSLGSLKCDYSLLRGNNLERREGGSHEDILHRIICDTENS